MPRTQAERRATTRAALLDATVSCLADLGYGGTTTTEIVKRAGVSRGAQVHHFPTKDVLVISAVEHLFDRRLEEYAKAFALVPDGQRDAATAIDLLWPMFDGPSFIAWLELVVAGRTNPALHAELQAVTARFDQHVAELFMDLFPGAPAEPLTDTIVRFAFTVLDGLALQRMAGVGERTPDILGLLKALGSAVLPTT